MPLRLRLRGLPRNAAGPGLLGGVRLAVVLLPAALAGCDSGSFVPPPPPELSSIPTNASAAPQVRTIELILAGGETPDRVIWETAGRQEAGKQKAIFMMSRLKDGEPPAREAELIRQAAKRGVSAVLVEPLDAPEVVEALNEVRAKGTSVLLLGRRVPSGDPAKPFPVVMHTPYGETVELLVGAIMSDLGPLALKDSHALVTLNTKFGAEGQAQAQAIAAALTKAGVAKVETVPFDGDAAAARKLLTAKIEADPLVHLIIGQEDEGLVGLSGAYDDTKAKHALCIGGLMTVGSLMDPSTMTNCAGVVDRNIPGFIREAVRQSLALADGRPIPDEIRVPMPFHARTIQRRSGLKVEDVSPPPIPNAR